MTNEEARAILEEVKTIDDSMYQYNPAYLEALDMAIAALKAEPCEDCHKAEEIMQTLCDYGCEMKIQDAISQVLETECTKCEDAVSRQAVFNQIFYSTDNSGDVELGSVLRRRIENLPPVTPKQRTGKWIRHTRVENVYDIAGIKTWGIKHQCDQCTFTTIAIEGFGYYDYCPHCGCRMEGESK